MKNVILYTKIPTGGMVAEVMRLTALLREALNSRNLVQSFSGVRGNFGEGPVITDEHNALANAYGFIYASKALTGLETGSLVIGRDPRPTGEAVAAALARGFLAGAKTVNCNLRIIDLGIITTPLIETSVRALESDGGVMITASHNPLTDNGFKFLTGCRKSIEYDAKAAPTGALLSSGWMAEIVAGVQEIAAKDDGEFTRAMSAVDGAFADAYGNGEDHVDRVKAERAYLDFIGAEWDVQPHCLKPLTLGPTLLDPNGGAACGIGARVLEHFGVRTLEVNAEIGYPEHGIDTDGIDPASGKHMLLRVARAALRASARFGIAFDYDADRGNLVLPGLAEEAIIHPQTVAAANIALALAHREVVGRKSEKLAVVMSDSTSGACEKVAAMFGAEAFMVETGEINVVTRMHQLRQQGYDVPVGVEGANGGTIFGESTCRDGLQTALCAALADEQPTLAERWNRVLCRNGHTAACGDTIRLPQVLAAVPVHYNRSYKLTSPPMPHGELKSRMEHYFIKSIWPKLSGRFQTYWFENYEGTSRVEKRDDETGGWRVALKHKNDEAFIFARGSRTEAGVWRIIVDSADGSLGAALAEAGMDMFGSATGTGTL